MRWGAVLGVAASIVGCSHGEGGGAGETEGPAVVPTTTSPADSEASSGSLTTSGGMPDDSDSATSGADEGSTTEAESSSGGGVARCGDGTPDPGEQCDDGNDINADGCNRDCRLSGQLVWQAAVGRGFGAVDQGFAVAPGGDGSALVSGYISVDPEGSRDGWLASFDASGALAWEVLVAGPGGGNDEIRAVVRDEDGSVFCAGYTSGPKGQGLNAWVARYDLAGAEAWSTTFNGPDSMTDVFDTLVLDADGNLIVGGYSQSMDSGHDVFLRKLSPDGSVLWSRVFEGPNGGADLVWDVDVSDAGHIYAAGYEAGPAGEGRNAWLAKYDTDGNEIWSRSFNGAASLNDHLIGVAVVGDDDVVVSGYEDQDGIPWQAIVRRYDSLGMIVWTDRYAGGTGEGAHGFGVAVDPLDGQIVVTGGEMVGDVRNVLVRKYDTDGNERWTSIVPGGATGPDYGRELAVDANGEVWVAGALDSGADARDIWVGRFTP